MTLSRSPMTTFWILTAVALSSGLVVLGAWLKARRKKFKILEEIERNERIAQREREYAAMRKIMISGVSHGPKREALTPESYTPGIYYSGPRDD
jgi:hypothetical protein